MPWRMLHSPFIGAHLMLRCNALIERGLYLITGNKLKMKDPKILAGYRFPFYSTLSRAALLAFPRNIPLHPGDLNWDRMARIQEGLKTLPCPCRLLWGEQDIVFPPENAARFQRLLPKCSAPRMIPHGKHFIQEDAPEEIAEEILDMVKNRQKVKGMQHGV
jgi:pimeloyl-ACP methyl ester carboxylesterase